ncbi:MAG TPA: hypothetical protein PLO37_17775 [Candidatus Hydrogenedentes bacterium]|nr:hypothetical protein [Candidatus Hydrogenedentota bacterium]HPG68699.1 hypothetical protein [Candidatus Hydrogenedentota bacterium]
MNLQASGLWLLVSVVSGAVGAGMLIYGIRQKAGLPLVFGVALSATPMITRSGGVAAILCILVGALFLTIRKFNQ